MKTEQRTIVLRLLRTISEVIVEEAKHAGPLGAPSGPVYARLSTSGVSLELYNAVVETLVSEKKIEVRGHCIHFLEDLSNVVNS